MIRMPHEDGHATTVLHTESRIQYCSYDQARPRLVLAQQALVRYLRVTALALHSQTALQSNIAVNPMTFQKA